MLIEQAAQGSRNTSCLFLYSRAPQEKTPGGKQTDAPRTAGVRSGTGEATWTLSRPPRPVERERETERQSVMKDRVRQAGKQTDRQMDRYREAHAGIYRYTHTYIFVYNTYIYAHITYMHASIHTYAHIRTDKQIYLDTERLCFEIRSSIGAVWPRGRLTYEKACPAAS